MLQEAVKWLAANKDALQGLTQLVSILGIPIFIVLFFIRTRRENIAKQEKIYDDVDQSFVSFNQLLLSYPDLNVIWFDRSDKELTEHQKIQQYILFDLLTNMFERAFLTYQNASGAQRRSQWRGWQDYIDLYCAKDQYQLWWSDNRHQIGDAITLTYAAAFEEFMRDRFAQARNAANRQGIAGSKVKAGGP